MSTNTTKTVEVVAEEEADTQPRAGLRTPRTFAALKHRNFRLFWTGNLISLVGTWMQIVAQGWLVYELTGSSLLLGLVGFASSMPTFIFSIPAGVWVDRYPKRTILLITQSTAMLLALVLAALVWSGQVQVWHIIALSMLLGMVNAIDAPARQAFTPEIASRADLMNAIALNSTAFNMARVIGPSVAGIMVGFTGLTMAFFLNGVSYLAVLAGLLLMRLPPPPARKKHAPVWETAREGFRYILNHTIIWAIISLMAVSSLFGFSYNTLMPILAGEILNVGVTGYGILMSAVGLGAVIGGLMLASLGNFRHKGWLLTTGNLVFPLFLYVVAWSRSVPLTVASLVIIGWAVVSQGALTNTLIQSTVPDELRGRVLSVYLLVFFGFMPLGSLWTGFVAERTSAPWAMTLGASIALTYALFILFRVPQVRALE